MSRLLRRSSRRYWLRHPLQAFLALAGVAAGVAVVLAVDLASDSAERAFRLSAEAVTGRATHQVVGGPAGLPEELFARLVRACPSLAAAPVLEETVNVAADGAPSLRLLGVDPISEGPFRSTFDGLGGGVRESIDLGTFLTLPGALLATAETAAGLGLGAGDRFTLLAGGDRRPAVLVGLLELSPGRSAAALEGVLVADLSTAQEVLGRAGRLSRIDLRLPEGEAGRETLEAVRRLLPEGTEVLDAAGRTAAILGMTEAFRLNLRALGLLALLCGAFLVYNTARFAVVQRQGLLGRLRALGVTGRETFRLVVGEAAVFGLAGALAGSALGVLLAAGLLRLVSRTINDLYFSVSVRGLHVSAEALLTGLAVGLAASVAAAWLPAREAAAAPPGVTLSRHRLEAATRHRAPRLAALGLGLSLAGALLLVPAGSVAVSFLGVLALLLGFAALTPLATLGTMAMVLPLVRRAFGSLGAMAVRGVSASLSRTGVAIAALALAVAVTVGIGVMIDSFRASVAHWLEHTLSADVYLSSVRSATPRRTAPYGPELRRSLAHLPGVDGLNTLRRIELETAEGPLRLAAVELDPRGEASYRMVGGGAGSEGAWRRWREGRAVLVSEPFAFRHRISAGDLLELPAEGGPRELPVAGVFVDYGSDQGLVMLHRSLYDRLWTDPGFDAFSLYLAPGAEISDLLEAARGLAAGVPGLVVRSNRELKSYSLEVFDRTFLITGVLRLLAGAVAFLGVLGALAALQLERRRELGVLRAAGLTPRQLRRLVVGQTGLMGLTAGLLSLPLGLVLAWIMVALINRRSFGWTLELSLSPALFAEALVLAVAAALLAGAIPAHRMAATSPAEALRGS